VIVQLWCEEADGRWGRRAVAATVQIGSGDDGRIVVGEWVPHPAVTIVPYAEYAKVRAVLVSSAGTGARVTVNGYPPLGLTLLEDRDEIVIRRERTGDFARFVFGELEAAHVVRFAEAPAACGDDRCARCRKRLQSGDAAVRCPVCGRWYHEGPLASGARRECFSYDPLCGGCLTARAAMSWSPGGDEEREAEEPASTEAAA